MELAPLADPALVQKTVAIALGLPETPGRPICDSLVHYLRQKYLLLILDNCEHLLDACASLADELLHACPRLTILASSREILGVEGEIPFRVPPMKLPDQHHLPALAELCEFDAVKLFVERGKVVAPGFEVTQGNAPVVVHIVNRLDGIPLAIELAAARLRLLNVDQIARRLDDAFRLLVGGSRSVLPRHQTLRALIDWSYNLLSEAEQVLLRRLSVFAGSWTLEAAEQVCAGDVIMEQQVLDLLGGLVDKSLVLTLKQEGDQIAIPPSSGQAALQRAQGLAMKVSLNQEMRYGMLETIRQYAHEKLVDEKESNAVRTRHLNYYCQLAERLGAKIRSREQIEILDQLELELPNLRLALEWALQTDFEAELRMATALKWLWHIRTYWNEGIDWLERGLEVEKSTRGDTSLDSKRAILCANALSVLGSHLFIKGFGSPDYSFNERSIVCLQESIDLFKAYQGENSIGYAYAVQFSGGIYRSSEQSRIQAQQALEIFRRVGGPHDIAEALQGLGNSELDPVTARKFHQEQLELDQANGDSEGIATAYWNIAHIDWQEAQWEKAIEAAIASLAFYRQVRNQDLVGTLLIDLGIAAISTGNLQLADHYLNEALVVCSELEDDYMVPWCLEYQSLRYISEGLLQQAGEATEKAWRICVNKGQQGNLTGIFAQRARLARLQGKPDLAHQLAQEGLKISKELQSSDVDLLLELGHQALECGNLSEAASYWREGVECLIQGVIRVRWNFYVDASALLAARQNRCELAVPLFGTRWYRGNFNCLSPSERAVRTAIQDEIMDQMGEQRFTQLYQEGAAFTFMQMLEIVKELLEID